MENTWVQFLTQFVTVGLGSGFAIVVVGRLLDSRKEKRRRTDNQRHLALRLAIHFEGYAINCVSMAVDNRTAVESEGHAGRFLSAVPELGSLPESSFYDLLDIDILNAVFDLPQRRLMADDNADFWVNTVGDVDSFRTAIEENTIKMGILAMEIARRLRTAYKLKPRDITFGEWNIDQHFAEEAKRLAELDKRRKAASA